MVEVTNNPPPKKKGRAKWPIYSDALGVNPDQIPEAQATLAKHGVQAQYTPDGRAIVNDARHRRDWCRAVGLFDRNGGYSDPQSQNR